MGQPKTRWDREDDGDVAWLVRVGAGAADDHRERRRPVDEAAEAGPIAVRESVWAEETQAPHATPRESRPHVPEPLLVRVQEQRAQLVYEP
jgi:hypothetical protein